jgi:outer membrane receptor protein involved in Fe transport
MVLPICFRFARSCFRLRPSHRYLALSVAVVVSSGAHAEDAVSLPTIEVTGEQSRPGGGTEADLSNLPVGASSELNISGQQINQRSFERPAEVLEVVPGLLITQHSGEGKANQYFLRGFNLDHGTDLAIWVDGMPCNMRTHAHGQGYCDLNFLIPELIGSANIRKGPYWADEGDFASVGNVHINLIDTVDKTIALSTLGSFDYRRFLGIASNKVGDGNLLVAAEAVTYDGPWSNPDDMFKLNGVLRFTQGTPSNGFSVTGWAYANHWNSTDQIPLRAATSGELGLYDAFDPTDGGNTSRFSVSGHWAQTEKDYATNVDFYAIKYSLNLWSDFTYVLVNPIDKDQFHQHDDRFLTGLSASHVIKGEFASLPTETYFGVQTRYDAINLGLTNTMGRQFLSNIRNDHVDEASAAVFAEYTVHWTDWFKTTVGWRGDVYTATVDSLNDAANSGSSSLAIGSPKFRAVLGPFAKTEFFFDAGEGFHSNDARGVTITQDPLARTPLVPSPFLVRQPGAEFGVRTKAIDGLTSSVSLWALDAASELVFLGDAGTTQASRPGHRYGIEFVNDYQPVSWLHLEADVAASHSRFVGFDSDQAAVFASLAGYPAAQIGNAPGNYIPGAPSLIATASIRLGEKLGWFGGLWLRYFGPRPLTEDGAFFSPATALLNAQLGYKFENGWRIQLDGFNITNSRSDQISYAYGSLLRTDSLFNMCFPGLGPPTAPSAVCQNGVMDRVFHPVEPLAVRLTIAGAF